ncbi:UDP-3-O-(3-hydroxymyristoyl)glucosamine N-acyltransferase [Ampullimonas aquatilis]
MSLTLKELVMALGGEVVGNEALQVRRIAPLDVAEAADLAFLANPKYRSQVLNSLAGAVVLDQSSYENLTADVQLAATRSWIVHPKPYLFFAHAAQMFAALQADQVLPGRHPSAVIAADAQIDSTATIGPHCVIESGVRIGAGVELVAHVYVGKRAIIGAGSKLNPHVSIYHDCQIGERNLIHASTVIGSDGFGFAKDGETWVKIPQTGRVIIGNDVEIGASCSIDRGAMADTVIEDGVILDNQIQIAHNVHIGAHAAIAGCVGIAGSARIGRGCTIGGSAGILGHLSLAEGVHISAFSLVTRSLSEPGLYSGIYPLSKNAEWERNAVLLRNLDKLRDRIKALEQQIKHNDKTST